MLFSIGSIPVYWYGLIIALGMGLGLYVAIIQCKEEGLALDVLVNFLLFALPVALVTTRLYYVAFNWTFYSQNPNLIFP